MTLSIPGQYSCTFFTPRGVAEDALKDVERAGWTDSRGYRPLGSKGLWYEFYCDAVTIPIEVEFAQADFSLVEAARIIHIELKSEGEDFFFWPLDDVRFEPHHSVFVPPGEYRLTILAFNPGVALDEEFIPEDYQSQCEYHRFVFIKK